MTTQLHAIVGPAAPATRSIIRVQKAKVKNQHLTCEFTEQRADDAPPRAFCLTAQEQVHPDLLHWLAQLVPHLCLLCEQLTETPHYWPDDETGTLPPHFEPFTLTGFSVGSGGRGVTLIGQRQLAGGKVLNLTSPYVSFDDEQPTYAYAGLLETALDAATTEVEAALRGKCTDYRQLDLFEPTADEPGTALISLIPVVAHA
ncbi:hypothetical protein [Hymenobacter psychrotolerans]|uniref:Uncharacterized protein n=1 Tax=Hymenobacter psychrotolerans DSM 18569 TaxID=1121959 RepID=A0A1M6UNP7_9BACT|nr:hypothetical protein [Hymenobacter psychrotolerans]SHK70770.1 hypothetical protein SAMN02746009_01424 [Hymenobacter psychrotolerans DSM 18569]